MADGTYRETLRRPGVAPFLWTQFLGAFNDNVLKIIVSFIAITALGATRGAAVVGAVFILPFLLFSGYAGELADRRSKRTVLVAVKAFELGIMLLATAGLLARSMPAVLGALFLMGVHSTFFSPAKYGIVPELLPDAELSRANGLLEMSTFAAIVLGTWFGGELFQRWQATPAVLGVAMLAIAGAGFATSLSIPRVAAAKPGARYSLDPWSEVWRGIKDAWPDRTLRMTIAGVSYFWFLGALLQLALLPLGQTVLHVDDAAATRLYTPLALGIAAGSLTAGRLSGRKIELGLVPVGSFGLGIFALLLAASTTYLGAVLALAVLGFFGGFFAVPLNALLQQRPKEDEKGRILSTNNFFNTVGILLAAGLLWSCGDLLHLTIRQTLFAAGVFTLLSNIYILALVPDFFVRFTLWCLTHTIYRIKIVGQPNVPTKGPALLICNHVSMIDGALVGACIQRFVRFIVYGPYFQVRGINLLMRRLHAIPVTPGQRHSIVGAIEQAHAELAAGHVVCIFAEGAVSRTGNLLPFKRGFEKIVQGLDVPIVPVYLDRVWGSIFSFKRGRFFWKLPEHLPYPVTVAFGAPLPSTTTANQAREAVMALGCEAMRQRRKPTELLPTAFLRTAKARWRRRAMADSTGQDLTYGRALVASMLVARAVERRTAPDERVGVLLPASVGGALANVGVSLAGRVPVNLNFTAGAEAMSIAVREATIAVTLTSRKFLAKASIAETPGMVFLEDLTKTFGTGAKLWALLQARLLPTPILRRRFASSRRTADSLATIIFSSGSTGQPKGVMISHANILANVDALAQIFPMGVEDCFIGVLPFFHSFGLTGTLWFPLVQGASAAFHPNPMDAKTVGELAEKYSATMLISTPTFCSAYMRRCTKEQFGKLKYAIVGAEKLRDQTAQAFYAQYGITLLEGYGCTEMSPVVAVNRPNVNHQRENQIGQKPGSVGHPIPGVAAMVVDRDTGEGPIVDREGLLLVKGPNLMQGYLNQPERTAEVMRDGWYVTGDIAKMDEDGFIFITDRLSRFSKIGGEMVPHLKIEEAINGILGEPCSAVTAIPDAAKGERLVAFYTKPDVTPEALWEQLSATTLPKLWLPRREHLIRVESIPTLGTGKVDLRGLKQLALSRAGSDQGHTGVRPQSEQGQVRPEDRQLV